ncbi:MAG: transporter [Nitrospirae bacterium]|nr:transporter [Nitrospirota bacterium]
MSGKARYTVFSAVFVLFFLCAFASAFSAEPYDTEGRLPSAEQTATTGPLITDTAIPQSKGTATLYIPFYFFVGSGDFGPHWQRKDAPGDFLSLDIPVQLSYGLADRTEVYLVVPYKHNRVSEAAEPGPSGERSANSGGPGDITFAFKRLLLEEDRCLPAMSALFAVGFPTGRHSHPDPALLGTDVLGSGSFSFTFGVNMYKVIQEVKLYSNVWYTLFTDATTEGRSVSPRDVFTFNLAAEYPLSRRWVLLGELVSSWDGNRLIRPRSDQPQKTLVSVVPALEFLPREDWNFAAGLKIDLFGRNSGYGYTPTFAVFYNF